MGFVLESVVDVLRGVFPGAEVVVCSSEVFGFGEYPVVGWLLECVLLRDFVSCVLCGVEEVRVRPLEVVFRRGGRVVSLDFSPLLDGGRCPGLVLEFGRPSCFSVVVPCVFPPESLLRCLSMLRSVLSSCRFGSAFVRYVDEVAGAVRCAVVCNVVFPISFIDRCVVSSPVSTGRFYSLVDGGVLRDVLCEYCDLVLVGACDVAPSLSRSVRRVAETVRGVLRRLSVLPYLGRSIASAVIDVDGAEVHVAFPDSGLEVWVGDDGRVVVDLSVYPLFNGWWCVESVECVVPASLGFKVLEVGVKVPCRVRVCGSRVEDALSLARDIFYCFGVGDAFDRLWRRVVGRVRV